MDILEFFSLCLWFKSSIFLSRLFSLVPNSVFSSMISGFSSMISCPFSLPSSSPLYVLWSFSDSSWACDRKSSKVTRYTMAVYRPLTSYDSELLWVFILIIQLAIWNTPVIKCSFVSLLNIFSSVSSRYSPYPTSANFQRKSKLYEVLWTAITFDITYY